MRRELIEEMLPGEVGVQSVFDSVVDARILDQYRSRTGRRAEEQADTQAVFGGYPDIEEARRPDDYDTDQDGIADAWERSHGLDPEDPSDQSRVRSDGYTNLEHFLFSLTRVSSR